MLLKASRLEANSRAELISGLPLLPSPRSAEIITQLWGNPGLAFHRHFTVIPAWNPMCWAAFGSDASFFCPGDHAYLTVIKEQHVALSTPSMSRRGSSEGGWVVAQDWGPYGLLLEIWPHLLHLVPHPGIPSSDWRRFLLSG